MMLFRQSIQRFTRCIHQATTFSVKSLQHNLPVSYIQSNSSWLNTINHSKYICQTEQGRQVSYGLHFPNRKTTDELISYGDELIKEISSGKVDDDDDMNTVRNSLSAILYQLYNRKDFNLLWLFERMKTHNAVNEAGYNIVMRHYADQKDAENVKNVFTLLTEREGVVLHPRSYVPLILVSLQLEDIDQSSKYLKEMVTCMGPKFKEDNFDSIINTCTELLTRSNQHSLEKFVYQVFEVLEEFGPDYLGKKLVDAIRVWFESDVANSWHIRKTSVGKEDGMCQYCKKRLKTASITPDRLVKLKRNLMTLIKSSIIEKENLRMGAKVARTNPKIKSKVSSSSRYFDFYDAIASESSNKNKNKHSLSKDALATSTSTSTITESLPESQFNTLRNLKNFLDKHGPFDVVIDGENCGYRNIRFDPVTAKKVTSVFIAEKKRILILCAGMMREELLTMQDVPPARQQLKQLMLYLNDHCSLFFVGSSIVDDYHILYTLIHYNFSNIQFVSRDLFRDHLFHLDDDNAADFQRWQQANQYCIKALTRIGTPIFKPRINFHVGMQRCDGGWHLPIDARAWYCISKKP